MTDLAEDRIPERVRRLMETDPAVKAVMSLYLSGECSYENACQEAMILLAESRQQLFKQMTRPFVMEPLPVPAPVPDVVVEKR